MQSCGISSKNLSARERLKRVLTEKRHVGYKKAIENDLGRASSKDYAGEDYVNFLTAEVGEVENNYTHNPLLTPSNIPM